MKVLYLHLSLWYQKHDTTDARKLFKSLNSVQNLRGERNLSEFGCNSSLLNFKSDKSSNHFQRDFRLVKSYLKLGRENYCQIMGNFPPRLKC